MGKCFLAFGMMIMMMSCGKDIDLFIPKASQAVPGDITRLMSRLKGDMAGDISTVISCPCSGDTAIQVDKDLVLVVPPDFIDLSVYPCTQGSFDLHVTVCDTRGEIMVAGIPTLSEGKLLESRLEFNLQVKDGSNGLRLNHGKQIRFLVNDPDPRDRMELFYGDPEGKAWIQADGNPKIWSNVYNSEWFIQDSSGSIISGFGYECFSDSMDWINVDAFFEVPAEQRTPVCVELPEEYTNTNSVVFLVFDDYRSILSLNGDPETKQFCEPYEATPLGFRATLVMIGERGDDTYYFDKQQVVITPDLTVTLEPKRTPYEEIAAYISSL